MVKTTKKKSTTNRNKLLKCPTGIKGFDEITEGGLPKNGTTLVSGNAGSGKTLFGIDFLIKGAIDYNEPEVLMSFEETKDELYKDVEAIEQENNEMQLAKEVNKKYTPDVLENGDTLKQLLARSRYLLFKHENKWTPSQNQRATILSERYPHIRQAYDLSMELGRIYHTTKEKGVAFTRLAKWYDKVEKANFKSFNTISKSIQEHYLTILNYFDNRSTNASAEAFNGKIKAFRAAFRGVKDVKFFLFRLANIYA